MVEIEPFVTERIAERLQQRDPVHAVVGRAERRLVAIPHRVVGDHVARDPVSDDERRRDDRDGLDPLAEPEPPQLARAVGRQRDRGADFAQLVRLLVDLDGDPALAQGERQDQAADPAADDGDLEPGHRQAIAGVRTGASAKSYVTSKPSSVRSGCTISSGLTALATSSSR